MENDAEPVATLLGFCSFVRRRGLPAGTDDAMTFAQASALLNPSRLEDLYWSGRVSLVHGRNQIPLYDECFSEYFLGGSSPPDGPAPISLSARATEAVVDVPSGDQPEQGHDTQEIRLGSQASPVVVSRTKSFSDCTEEELDSLRRIISTLRADPPLRRTRRTRAATRGNKLDLRRIARESMRAHGEPGDLWWKRRRHRARPLVLILDISGSMADYSRNLVQFAHSTRTATGRVEVFCFGTRLTRITPSLRRRNPDDALRRAGEEVVDWAGGTRIGSSLDTFVRRYARRGMARGAFVIICSDGMDRGDPALLDDALDRLGRLSYRVIWVNPMQGDHPDAVATSLGMSVALPHVDLVWSGHNLDSLETFAEALPGLR